MLYSEAMCRRLVLLLSLTLGLTLAACSWIDPPQPHFETALAKAGPFEGQVSAIHADVSTVSTERKTSEGTVYLTVEVRPATDLTKIHVGDRIEGKIVVESPRTVYATDVRIIR